jgi:hypothetical protein
MVSQKLIAGLLVLAVSLTGCVKKKEAQEAAATDFIEVPADVAEVAHKDKKAVQCKIILRANTLPPSVVEGNRRIAINQGSTTITGTLITRNIHWVEIETDRVRYSIPVDRIALIQFPKHAHGDHDHAHDDQGGEPDQAAPKNDGGELGASKAAEAGRDPAAEAVE